MQLQSNADADREGFELFRRAIEERDEQAWSEGSARYRPLLAAWAGRCGGNAGIRERCDDIADNAYARAWVAMASKSFASFPTLAALLGYLRMCVMAVVIDNARVDMHIDRLGQAIEADAVVTPEQIVLDQLDRDELWRIASSVAQTAQERCILVASYLYNLSPQAILERYPDLFANVSQIYAGKRNLLSRLKRYPAIQRLHREQLSP
jgi:DNA-directed RNA polymerase specialized sigma24 family protein